MKHLHNFKEARWNTVAQKSVLNDKFFRAQKKRQLLPAQNFKMVTQEGLEPPTL